MSLCGYEDEIDWRESLEPETFTVLNMPLYLLEFGTLMMLYQQSFITFCILSSLLSQNSKAALG